ncbi:hypothetical protein ES703_55843 [subsurface metagenome]
MNPCRYNCTKSGNHNHLADGQTHSHTHTPSIFLTVSGVCVYYVTKPSPEHNSSQYTLCRTHKSNLTNDPSLIIFLTSEGDSRRDIHIVGGLSPDRSLQNAKAVPLLPFLFRVCLDGLESEG